MRFVAPALAVLLLAGCTAPEPMPVPTAVPSPSLSGPSSLPLPGTGFLQDQLDLYGPDTRVPTVRFETAHIAGEGENFTFTLPDGTWALRVACATDASDSVDVTLVLADGRPGVEYEAYCGDTPPSGIVTATTQGDPFSAGGDVAMRVESDSRFVAAVGLVPVG